VGCIVSRFVKLTERRVAPVEHWYDSDEEDVDVVNNGEDEEASDRSFGTEQFHGEDMQDFSNNYAIDHSTDNEYLVSSVRVGLFAIEEKIKLREGYWRNIKGRVTQIRGLHSIYEMNRRQNIVAAVDSEIFDYGSSMSDSSLKTLNDEEKENKDPAHDKLDYQPDEENQKYV
jgi:hypothetical protein